MRSQDVDSLTTAMERLEASVASPTADETTTIEDSANSSRPQEARDSFSYQLEEQDESISNQTCSSTQVRIESATKQSKYMLVLVIYVKS